MFERGQKVAAECAVVSAATVGKGMAEGGFLSGVLRQCTGTFSSPGGSSFT